MSCENDFGARIVKTLPVQPTTKYADLVAWAGEQFKSIHKGKPFKLRAKEETYVTNEKELQELLKPQAKAYNLWLELL